MLEKQIGHDQRGIMIHLEPARQGLGVLEFQFHLLEHLNSPLNAMPFQVETCTDPTLFVCKMLVV